MLQRQSESVFRDRCDHIVRLFPKKLRALPMRTRPPPRAAGRSFGPSPSKGNRGRKAEVLHHGFFMPPALDRPFKMTSRMECSRRMREIKPVGKRLAQNARDRRTPAASRQTCQKAKVRHSSVGMSGSTPMLLSHANSRPRDGGCIAHPSIPPCSDSNRISMPPHAYPASRICATSVCGIVRYSRSFPSEGCVRRWNRCIRQSRARICGSMCRNGRPVLIMRMCPALCAFSARHARFLERRGPMSRSSRPHQKRGSFYSYFYYHPPTVCHKAAEM